MWEFNVVNAKLFIFPLFQPQACASLEPNYQPPVTFVVVQKRHHTRLFASNHHDKSSVDRSDNILLGICFSSLFGAISFKETCLTMVLNNFTYKILQAELLILKSAMQQGLTFIFIAMLEYRWDLLLFLLITCNFMLNYILIDVNHVLHRVQPVLLTITCCGWKQFYCKCFANSY